MSSISVHRSDLRLFRPSGLLSYDGYFEENGWLIPELGLWGFGPNPPGQFRIVSIPDFVFPAFVNSHTHLEFEFARPVLPKGSGIPAFVKSLRNAPAAPGAVSQAMQKAREEATGYFLNHSNRLVAEVPGVHSLGEILGYSEKIAWQRYQALASASDSLTPHSIYGTHPAVIREISGDSPGITSIHFLEDPEERGVFSGTGRITKMLQEISQWGSPADLDPVSLLTSNISPARTLLLVHMTDTSAEEWSRIRDYFPDVYWVICHRSNLCLNLIRSNWDTLSTVSDRLLIGTDSLASCPDLSIYREMISLEEFLPANLIWRAATWNAYAALSLMPNQWYSIPASGRLVLPSQTGPDFQKLIE